MMINLRNWWHAKSNHKKQNWCMLALVACFIASGLVEAISWMAIAGVIPAAGIIWLEVSR